MERYPILVEEQTTHGPATFPCAVYQVKAAQNKREKIYCHWHKEVELLLILAGSASLYIGQKIYPISAGTFALIPSNAVHMVLGDENTEFRFIAIVFHPDFLRSFGSDSIQEKYLSPLFQWQFDCSPVLSNDPAFCDLILDITSAYQEKADGYELYIKACLLQLCFLLYQYAKDFQFQKQDSKDYRISFIKEMMLYLQEQYSETVTLSEMADHFHISKGHLCRFFKEMTNMSPIDYLNYYRIHKSSQLLRDTDLSISTVAGQAGFNNISYYNRTFRKYMHMTPGEYRKNLV
ncbi:MAG: AraC family transcriptional regulator [Fusicatenibacter sp.]|nr:AraC family transcriptional regulator [Fusicatenibacter sp.]